MNIWDKTKPLPSEYINTFYDYIRNLKELFLDRFGLDHNMDGVLDTSLATADGYHKHLTMRDYEDSDGYGNTIITPIYTEDSQQLFVKKIDGLHELCIQDDDGIYQITKNGKQNIALFKECLTSVPTSSFRGSAFGNGIFVAVTGAANTKIYKVKDDFSGLEILTSSAPNYMRSEMLFHNNYFYICNGSGLEKTEDFSSFNQIITGGEHFGIKYLNGLYITCGDNGKIYTSTDGITWTSRVSGTTEMLYSIAYGNGKYVISGVNVILYSSDAITWTKITTSKVGRCIEFGNGLFFIGVVEDGYYTSTNGIDWTHRTNISFYMRDIIFIEPYNFFIVCGHYGNIFKTYDCINFEDLKIIGYEPYFYSISADDKNNIIAFGNTYLYKAIRKLI